MRRTLFALLLCAPSCTLFSSPDVQPALDVNARMDLVFTNHSNAFEKLMLRAQMEDSVREAVLDLIQQDRAAFARLNTAMAQYIGAVGELTTDEINAAIDKALAIYREVKGAESQ